MKRLLLLVALNLPAALLAQQVDPELQKLEKLAVELDPQRPEYFYPSMLLYRNYYILLRGACLYRSLADARREQCAWSLRPGDTVFATGRPAKSSRWLLVARDTYVRDTPPVGDVTLYYLPLAAVIKKEGSLKTYSIR